MTTILRKCGAWCFTMMCCLMLIGGCKKSTNLQFQVLPMVAENSYDFLRGADVSFLTQMERANKEFFNASEKQDLFVLLKQRGINAIRLRVWVNPTDVYQDNAIADVVNKAVRAKAAGMTLLIDFHYSDYWADPKKQNIPAAWANYSLNNMKLAVAAHTTACLTALNAEGIIPEYVQVGNETDFGMLWPMGDVRITGNMVNYAALYKAGYEAVKSFNNAIKVVVHFSRGYDNANCEMVLDGLISNGAMFDVVGISVYPNSGNYTTVMSQSLSNLQSIVSKYDKDVMVAECGFWFGDPRKGRIMVSELIAGVSDLPDDHGLGVYYWEPQAYASPPKTTTAFDVNTKEPLVTLDGFSYVKNPGFEVDTLAATNPAQWVTTGGNPDANYTETTAHTGNFRLTHYKSSGYNVATSQTITGLSNGLYTLTAWVVSPQLLSSNNLFAKDFGGTQLNFGIPVKPGWQKVKIENINVVNGQCTIGLSSSGNAKYCSMDDVQFFKQ